MSWGDLYPYTITLAKAGDVNAARALFGSLAKELFDGKPISPALATYFAPLFEKVATADSGKKLNISKLFNLQHKHGGQHTDELADYHLYRAMEKALQAADIKNDILAAALRVEEEFDFAKHNRKAVKAERLIEIYKSHKARQDAYELAIESGLESDEF